MNDIDVKRGSYAWPTVLRSEGGGRLSLPHLAGGLGGSVVGFFVGELLNTLLKGNIHNILLVGLYFAQMALFILIGLAVSEKLYPSLHPDNSKYLPDMFSLLLPAIGLGVFFALGCLFQFIYGLTPVKTVPVQAEDYIIAIDNSGSTAETDPDRSRFTAVLELFDELNEANNAGVIVFTHEAATVIEPGPVDDAFRTNAEAVLSGFDANGGTDIESALRLAESLCDPNRQSMVILLSDGESSVNVRSILDSYSQKQIVLNTVGYAYNRIWGTRLLERLADMTGGTFYQVNDIGQLGGAMSQAASHVVPERSLLSYRHGFDRGNIVSLLERILFIALLVAAMCAVLALAAGDKDVGLFYLPQKAVMGGIAGLVLEIGLFLFAPEPTVRLAVALFLGLFLATHRRQLETRQAGEGMAASFAAEEKIPAGTGRHTRSGPA